ncbi:hypothetical protein N0V90_011579 [Kalmusia sp. IMI 367209]|nr:hypothetical protein N0V90_011579 [Kalmusia sp. IMI 367209]
MAADIDVSMVMLQQLHEDSLRKQQQIQHLQKEKCMLEEQFEKQLLEHAQADCRQLMNLMHTKLPQELKELIYQYLYLEEAPIPIGTYHFTTYVPEPLRVEHSRAFLHSEPFVVVPEGATKQDHSIERDKNIVFPDSWLLNPAYLGGSAARDASRYYYKSNTFSICTIENALWDFFFRDPVHNFVDPQEPIGSFKPLGFTPVDHIRHLQIRVKYEHYNTYLAFYDNLQDGEKNLIRDLFHILQGFTNRVHSTTASQLNIEICIMTAHKPSQGERDFNVDLQRHHTNLLEAIRVPIYTLKHDLGAHITVMHYDEHCIPFPRNVTAIFQLSKEQWTYG